MAQIVAVHGVGQQTKGPQLLHHEWYPALLSGLALAGAETAGIELACAFYGDLFRPPGQTMAFGDPPYRAGDVASEWEAQLLAAWWQEAARTDPQVVDPEAPVMVRTPRSVQRALNALSGSRFFAGLAERALVFDLKQVRRYLQDKSIRVSARERLAAVIGSDTRVVVGHSLGSVVAYEALCAHPSWPVRTLITLGSPLGIRHLIFDRLEPPPMIQGAEAVGIWPDSIERWTNIADGGDVIALVKDLRPKFGERVKNVLVYNGATAHDVRPYLTAKETGRAVAVGLAR
jgi:hypothetical protein